MRSPRLSIAAALAALGLAHAAHALNFCFNPGTDAPDPKSLAVAQHFKKPAKGACSAIHGFDIESCKGCVGGPPLVDGTACLNSAGDTLHVAYTIELVIDGDTVEDPVYVTMNLPYPGLQGGRGNVVRSDFPGADYGSSLANANPCIPPVIAIP